MVRCGRGASGYRDASASRCGLNVCAMSAFSSVWAPVDVVVVLSECHCSGRTPPPDGLDLIAELRSQLPKNLRRHHDPTSSPRSRLFNKPGVSHLILTVLSSFQRKGRTFPAEASGSMQVPCDRGPRFQIFFAVLAQSYRFGQPDGSISRRKIPAQRCLGMLKKTLKKSC